MEGRWRLKGTAESDGQLKKKNTGIITWKDFVIFKFLTDKQQTLETSISESDIGLTQSKILSEVLQVCF